MIEFIFTFFPSLIIGVIFIILGFKLKSNKENKYKNGVKARVVSIKVNEKRTKEGYLKQEKYTLTLEYLYKGQLIKGKIDSIYDYEIDSEIVVQLYDDKVAFILSDPSKNITDNYNSLNLSGYMILLGIGFFLVGFTFLGIIVHLGSAIDEKYISAFVIIIILIIIGCIFIRGLLKASKLLKEVKYLEYEKIVAKVVDIKNSTSSSDNNIKKYYPVIQFDYDGKTYNKVIYESKELYELNIGNEIIIYKHRKTNEIITDMIIKKNQFNFRLFFIMILMVLVGIVSTMLLCI